MWLQLLGPVLLRCVGNITISSHAKLMMSALVTQVSDLNVTFRSKSKPIFSQLLISFFGRAFIHGEMRICRLIVLDMMLVVVRWLLLIIFRL